MLSCEPADFIQILSGRDGLAAAVKEPHEHPVVVNYFGAQEAPLIRKLANAGMDNTLTGDPDLCLGFPALHSVPLAS